MPIHEYQCVHCNTDIFEKYVGMNEDVKCISCKRKLKPLLSQSSFILKGGGWACSGYSKKDKGGN